MVASAESVEWIQVRNDVEALMLEYSLIKQHKPRFNVRLRDDKSYPFLVLTTGDGVAPGDGPAGPARAARTPHRYFGPYAHAYAIRETLDLLLRTFPVRSCSDGKFARHRALAARASCTTSSAVPARAPASSTREQYSRPGRGLRHVPRRRHRPGAATGWRRRCARRRPTSSSSWRPACGTASRLSARPSRSSRW